MLTKPLVSIVLSSYNQPELLDVAFQSLINQTYKNIEIIIVDDCSINPLNKEYILRYYQMYPSIVKYILHSENKGIACNKNSGFKIATGSFITYLDGDDFYFPDKIEDEVTILVKNPDSDLVYSNFVFANPDGELLDIWGNEFMPRGNIFKEIVAEKFPNKILFRYELIKYEILHKYNYYDERLRVYEDWDLRIRYSQSANILYNNRVSSAYRRTLNSITKVSSLTKMLDQRILVIKINQKLIESNIELIGFYKRFMKQSVISFLFDNSNSNFYFIILCIKVTLVYPLSFIEVLRAVKYRTYSLLKRKRV